MTSQSDAEEAVSWTSGLGWLLPTSSLLISLILGLVLWQCAGGAAEAGAPSAERGLVAYREAGCGACHGQTALGGSGPALGGHRADQVVRQTRAPFGAMPIFTQIELNEDDLAAIVAFVDELEPVDHSVRWGTGFDPRDALFVHHWLALTAIQSGDVVETAHQIDHINEFIAGEHLEAMQNISDLLDAGETTGAELALATMTTQAVPDAALVDMVNLRLAAQSLATSDSDEAIRHLEAAANGSFAALAVQAQEAIEAGAPEDGAALLIDALGDDAPDQ